MASKTDAIIIDIDGTLSNFAHRAHLLTSKRDHSSQFYKKMKDDTPNQWCVDIVKRFSVTHEVVCITARSECLRTITNSWINVALGIEFTLIMRSDCDYRNDFEVKSEIYDSKIKDNYNILFVIDDRKSVVKMWRQKGLICLQCAEGDD